MNFQFGAKPSRAPLLTLVGRPTLSGGLNNWYQRKRETASKASAEPIRLVTLFGAFHCSFCCVSTHHKSRSVCLFLVAWVALFLQGSTPPTTPAKSFLFFDSHPPIPERDSNISCCRRLSSVLDVEGRRRQMEANCDDVEGWPPTTVCHADAVGHLSLGWLERGLTHLKLRIASQSLAWVPRSSILSCRNYCAY